VILDFDATHIPSHGDQDEVVLPRIPRPSPPSGPPPWRLPAVCSASPVEYQCCYRRRRDSKSSSIHRIRTRFPSTGIIFRGDSVFRRDAVLNVAGAAKSPLYRRIWLRDKQLVMSHWGSAPGSQAAPSEIQ